MLVPAAVGADGHGSSAQMMNPDWELKPPCDQTSASAMPLIQDQLPGHAKAVVHPGELAAETVVVQRHQHAAAFGQRCGELADLLLALAHDEQRERWRESEVV